MSSTPEIRHANTVARDFAVQFLYQCECEKIFLFSAAHVQAFVEHFNITPTSALRLTELASGTLEHMSELDALISSASQNWSLQRMGATDRSVLRLAAYELVHSDTPTKVILNEAIELAKKYGSESSGAFVNGILDKLAKSARP